MSIDENVKGGRCLCGQVRYEYRGRELWCGHCHCESCRRNTSSPFTSFLGVPRSAHRFTGRAPQIYRSSPGVERLFCGNCGTPMAYRSDRYPDEIHCYAASLDEPNDYRPRFHVHCAEQVPWVELADDLRRYPRGGDD